MMKKNIAKWTMQICKSVCAVGMFFLLACSNSSELGFVEIAAEPDDSLEIAKKTEALEIVEVSENFWGITEGSEDVIEFAMGLAYQKNDFEYPYVGLPRLVISTENGIGVTSKENYVNAKLQIFENYSVKSGVYDLHIRGRGNTTWKDYPKKPYLIKFDKKTSLFGMRESKKWVLLANYRDRTLMRNALAFKIASETDMEWVSKGFFVELILNGQFLGNYYLCEKVENKEERLNAGADGFLLEMDTHFDEEYKFESPIKKLPINIKSPESPSAEALAYIRDYIDTVESIVYKKRKDLNEEDYLDFESFADYLIVYEIAENTEPTNPKSAYMYKRSGEALKAGPVWDFDYNTFSPHKKGLQCAKSLWYDKLMKNESFVTVLKEKWNKYKDVFAENISFIDSLADYNRLSNERNIKLWPIKIFVGKIGDEEIEYDEAISSMKSIYLNRLAELDSLINKL